LGILLDFGVWEISIIVILSEFALMFAVDLIFVKSIDRLSFLHRVRSKSERFQERMKERRMTSALVNLGWLGPFIITALPFTGGVWSGMALSRIMALSHKKMLLAVSCGAVIGCLIFALAALGVLSIIEFN
jgi:uncharacterized membrane protein